jgi:uncharacterized membrane protein
VGHDIGIMSTIMSVSPDDAMRIMPFLNLMTGIVASLISVPLIRGKVPPNSLYGIRTKFAFSSEENWYRINRYGGKMFLRAGLLITVMSVVGLFLPVAYLTIYSIIAAVVVLGSILGAALMCIFAG